MNREKKKKRFWEEMIDLGPCHDSCVRVTLYFKCTHPSGYGRIKAPHTQSPRDEKGSSPVSCLSVPM